MSELIKLQKNQSVTDVYESAENALIDNLFEKDDDPDADKSACVTHIGLLILWIGKVFFDFLLNSTSMVQFFSNFFTLNQNDPVFYLPNLIYN